MNTIVVGIDESEEARAALAWALEEARSRGATLRVIHAWVSPALFAYGAPTLAVPEMNEALEEEAERVLSEVIDAVVGGDDPGVELRPEIVHKPAAQALLEAAEDADLLVVGSRGRGGFAGLLLGSTSQQCAHHAVCPVVVVRA